MRERLKSAERRQARDELLKLQTLTRVADASSGSEEGNWRLSEWSERLQAQGGVALSEEQKAALNAKRFLDKVTKRSKGKRGDNGATG